MTAAFFMATSEHGCIDEQTAADFVAGRLDPSVANGVEAHMSRCADCRRVISALALSLPAADAPTPPDDELEVAHPYVRPRRLARGVTLGRYLVLDPVGTGAMGQVYVAHDGKLDRKVALKVLHPNARAGQSVDHAKRSIVAEAKALARVAHPNVIAVHDVGSEGDVVFVAMELVLGTTLAEWIDGPLRSPAETLAVFEQAGAGLAAAHQAGLVHRDFKPSNVLVADDGRVRVLDFGLARALPEIDAAGPGEVEAAAGDITQTGAVLGTPAYMAPEQLRGERADPRADQFAFCVTLYEALYGRRPFPAIRANERLAQIDRGPPATTPTPDVPAWLHATIVRGLAPDREQRWPTMDALLDHIEGHTRPSRRRLPLLVSVVAGIGVSGALVWGTNRTSAKPLPCSDARRHLEGRWDTTKKDEVREAMLATEVAWAQPTWSGVEARLDAYAEHWAAVYTETCEATRVHGEQTDAVFDLRMHCLERRAGELGALTERLSVTDPEIVTQALPAARGLRSPDACSDIETLLAVAPRPTDPEARKAIARVSGELARAEALRATGDYVEGLDVARRATERAAALAYRPLEAEAQLAEGRLLTANSDDGLESFYRALWAAEAGRDDASAVRAATELANTHTDRAEFEQAARWIEHARALLERRGSDETINDALEIELARVVAELHHESGDYPRALEAWEQLVAAIEGETPQLASYLGEMGATLQRLGRLDQANRAHTRSLAVFEQNLGPDHPAVAEALNLLASTLTAQGEPARSKALHERALSIRERAFGPDHFSVAVSLANLGTTHLGLGEVDEAVVVLRRAEAIMHEAAEEPHVYALVLQSLGNALRLDRQLDEAVDAYARALELSADTLGAEHPSTAICEISLSAALYEQGAYEPALAHAQRALAARSAALGPNNPELAYDHGTVGRTQLALGRTEAAMASFETGMRLVNDAGRATRAELQFGMARALWPTDRVRADELLAGARADAAVLGERARPLVVELDAWIRDNP